MTEEKLYSLKYPIGTFVKPEYVNNETLAQWISDIEHLPKNIEALTKDLSPEQLQWVYRPNGWNIKQVVHHCADSHVNAFIRFKLALTEDSPTIKPYLEDLWANLIDANADDLTDTLFLLKGLHAKLSLLLRYIPKADLSTKSYIHPQHGKRFTLDEAVGMYAWHSNHHLAHIKQALEYKGQF
uniref:YfiT family bacillithiol transferase n=1 Tax=Gelidibacter sp. TaxID=2018083 RepID=UPI00404ABD0B